MNHLSSSSHRKRATDILSGDASACCSNAVMSSSRRPTVPVVLQDGASLENVQSLDVHAQINLAAQCAYAQADIGRLAR